MVRWGGMGKGVGAVPMHPSCQRTKFGVTPLFPCSAVHIQIPVATIIV